VAIVLPTRKKSSRIADFDTLPVDLYYKRFSITGWQLIWLHQTYIEALQLTVGMNPDTLAGPTAYETTIENIAYPYTGQSGSRLRK